MRRSTRLQTNGALADLNYLLARCAGGDSSAFEQLYRLQSARLYGVALRITREAGLAADALHEAMLQVWKNAGRFDPARGTPESWLLGLVRYRALDIARRQVREAPSDTIPEGIDEGTDALAALIASGDGIALARCLGQLPPDRQRLIRLAFTEGLSHSELAAQLGEPLGTVKSWIRRALGSLRRCLVPAGTAR